MTSASIRKQFLFFHFTILLAKKIVLTLVLSVAFSSAQAQSDGGFVGKLGEVPTNPFLQQALGRPYDWEYLGERELTIVMEQTRLIGRYLSLRDNIGAGQLVVRRVLFFPNGFSRDFRAKVGSWWLDVHSNLLRGRSSSADVNRCISAFADVDLESADTVCGTRDLDFSFWAATASATYAELRISRASRFGLGGASVNGQPWFSLAIEDAQRLMDWLDRNRENISRGDDRYLSDKDRAASDVARFVLSLLIRRTLEGANGRESPYPDSRWLHWTEREREQIGAWWFRFAEAFSPRLSLELAGCRSAIRQADLRRGESNCGFSDLGLRLR